MAPERAVKTMAYPVFQVHGEADTRVPVSQGIRVHAAAPPGSTIWLVPNTEHVNAFTNFPDEYVERVSGYFAQRLG